MRTEILVPRPVSEAAERMAEKLRISLSDLYTAALTTYVMRHHDYDVTTQLNQVYDAEESALDPMLLDLQVAGLGSEQW